MTSSCQGIDGQICVDRQYAQASRKTERQNADIDFGPVQDFPGLIIHRHCHFVICTVWLIFLPGG